MKKYFKSYQNKIFDNDDYIEMKDVTSLPNDTSKLYEVLKTIKHRGTFFSSRDLESNIYTYAFDLLSLMKNESELTSKILKNRKIIDILFIILTRNWNSWW